MSDHGELRAAVADAPEAARRLARGAREDGDDELADWLEQVLEEVDGNGPGR